jgi:hypothetical protein
VPDRPSLNWSRVILAEPYPNAPPALMFSIKALNLELFFEVRRFYIEKNERRDVGIPEKG